MKNERQSENLMNTSLYRLWRNQAASLIRQSQQGSTLKVLLPKTVEMPTKKSVVDRQKRSIVQLRNYTYLINKWKA